MPSLTTTYDRIVRQPALTMPGNATGSEAACTALTGSQIRALCGLGTTDNVTFNTVTATTSVQTPLVNNASAALTLGNSTYGVTVPGFLGVGGSRQAATFEVIGNDSGGVFQRIFNADSDNLQYATFGLGGSTAYGIASWVQSLIFESTTSGGISFSAFHTVAPIKFTFGASRSEKARFSPANGHLLLGTTTDDGTSKLQVAGAATFSGVVFGSLGFRAEGAVSAGSGPALETGYYGAGPWSYLQGYNRSTGNYTEVRIESSALKLNVASGQSITTGGDISMSKTSAQGYIRAYNTAGTANIAMYHDGQGRISTSTGGVYLTPADGMTGCYTPLIHSTFVVYSSNATHNISLASNGINGILSTSSGNLNLVPAGGTVAVTGGITASGAIQETYRTSSLDPTVSDIGSGKAQRWYNTTATEFRDWVNVGGTLYKSAAYT